jgi:hypothetical protein
MRRILLILALLLLAGSAASAQTLIGNCDDYTNSPPSCTVTWSGTATLIEASCSIIGNAPTDTLSLGWHAIEANADADYLWTYYAYGSFSGGTDTVSCASGGAFLTVQVFSGTPTGFNPADGSNNNNGNGQDPGSLLPSQSGDLFISTYGGFDGSGDCSSVSTGTIANDDYNPSTASQADAYYHNTGSGAIDMVWTCADGDDAESNVAAFKTSGSVTKAATPTCTPSSGTVPQTVSCSSSSATFVTCYAVSPTNPVTNGFGLACTTGSFAESFTVSVAETINVVAGTSYTADSNVASYTYTGGGSVKRHRASVVQK